LGFDEFKIRINHRQLLTALLEGVGLAQGLHSDALVALDKLDKIGVDGVKNELASRGLSGEVIAALLSFSANPAFELVSDSVYGQPKGEAALANLNAILSLAADTSAAGRLQFDPYLARGLSYYTGAIMEINVADLAGSLGGGGRYDNLIGMFLGQNIPACGFSLGLERILVVMTERNMFPSTLATTPADVMIATFDASGAGAAMRLAAMLRATGLRVLVYPDPEKIGKQIKYADSRRIPFVALLGDDEIKAGTVTVKNLAAQTQATYDQSAAGAAIRQGLEQRG
jgi:histidyl-tRNA synthetase